MKTSWLACRPIAHRGLHDEKYPENSLPAFIAAAENNYPIELDVQLSADDVIVVFHDSNTPSNLLHLNVSQRNGKCA